MLLRADTEEFTYKFSSHSQSDLKANAFELLGLVFGKAIFEKIPLNCYLDRTIIKQILEKEIILSDIVYYDKQVLQ
jgi:E3 ubiquitin-protein ligase HUWE1